MVRSVRLALLKPIAGNIDFVPILTHSQKHSRQVNGLIS